MSDTIWSAIINFFARIISAVIGLFKKDNTKQDGNHINQFAFGKSTNKSIITSNSSVSNDIRQIAGGGGENTSIITK